MRRCGQGSDSLTELLQVCFGAMGFNCNLDLRFGHRMLPEAKCCCRLCYCEHTDTISKVNTSKAIHILKTAGYAYSAEFNSCNWYRINLGRKMGDASKHIPALIKILNSYVLQCAIKDKSYLRVK